MAQSKGVSRRQFLQNSGATAAGLAAAGGIVFGPDHAWALSTKTLDAHTAETLLGVARAMFPHDRLGDQYYAAVVEKLDAAATGDPALRSLIADGVARLDAARGMPWLKLSEGGRTAALKSLEATEFFAAVRTQTVDGLYGNPLVYRYFGYEGSSVEYGGYLERGFDDIGWLPKI